MDVSVLSHPGVGTRPVSSHPYPQRIVVARALGVLGLIAYNWWVLVLFQPGWTEYCCGFVRISHDFFWLTNGFA